jgi:anti-anti-sigma regulatory factor
LATPHPGITSLITVFTSQRLHAVVPPGEIAIREQRLDSVVHQLEIRGSLAAENIPAVARRIDAALQAGVRWLIIDLSQAAPVADPMIAALVATARECRARRGELIVSGALPDVAARISAFEVAHRPALAANADQAVMILKMLRPKTKVERPTERARQRITSLTLPRIEPRPLN